MLPGLPLGLVTSLQRSLCVFGPGRACGPTPRRRPGAEARAGVVVERQPEGVRSGRRGMEEQVIEQEVGKAGEE